MITLTATTAKKNLNKILERSTKTPVKITSKHGSVVVVSKKEYDSIFWYFEDSKPLNPRNISRGSRDGATLNPNITLDEYIKGQEKYERDFVPIGEDGNPIDEPAPDYIKK